MNTATRSIIEERIEHECPSLPISNCASCKKLLVSVENKRKYGSVAQMIETVWVRVRNVPFCQGCSSEGEVVFVLDARKRGVS